MFIDLYDIFVPDEDEKKLQKEKLIQAFKTL
jgi:hypothetical protein